MNFVREKVSKKKKRFKEDGFDLDLTYITPRIIAMGFPSSDMEGLYRNPIGEVYKFYESRHRDHYKLYNLCAEREYDPEKFHGRVERYPFEDHNAPPIQLMVDCCNDIHDWLARNENNVVGINCKAGKGRTGLIICCYLMHSKVVSTSEEAMVYYGTRRTKDGKGVTIASQKRYVKYYEEVLSRFNGLAPEPRLLKLSKIRIHTIPNFSGKPFVSIVIKGREVCISDPVVIPKNAKEFEIPVDYPVFGDVKVQLSARKSKKKHQKMCHFWFSTAFVDPSNNYVALEKKEIDVANKDKKCSHFKEEFRLEVFFEDVEEPKKKESKRKSPKSDTDKKSKRASQRKSKEKLPIKDEQKKDESEDFGKRRKRAQSFYDVEEEDEDLSDSEKDEKEMEQYFVEEDDDEEEEEEEKGSDEKAATKEKDNEVDSSKLKKKKSSKKSKK